MINNSNEKIGAVETSKLPKSLSGVEYMKPFFDTEGIEIGVGESVNLGWREAQEEGDET